jgi:1,4-dihydroxy-2-naphthoyl-CoA synthase
MVILPKFRDPHCHSVAANLLSLKNESNSIWEVTVPDVRCERKGQALWLTIDREERRNALNEAVLDGLRAGVVEAERTPDVRAVVITGAGDKAKGIRSASTRPSATIRP